LIQKNLSKNSGFFGLKLFYSFFDVTGIDAEGDVERTKTH